MEYPDPSPKISSDRSRGGAGRKSRRRRKIGGRGRRYDRCVAEPAEGSTPPVSGVRSPARKLVAGLWRSKATVKADCGGGGGGLTCHDEHHNLTHSKSAKEGATKWDHHFPNTEACQFHRNLRLMKNQQTATTSDAQQIELYRARHRISELETERHLFKKKLNHFLRGIAREMNAKMRRDSEKMVLIVDELKSDLEREKKNHQRLKILNDMLTADLDEARLSNQKMATEFEEEKRARGFLENLCQDLGKDLQDLKANIVDLKSECARIQEEAEEERKVMQMAEMWREERVQMKLVDARLILEEKCSQMNSLISDLESLLKSNENPMPISNDGDKVSSSHDPRFPKQGHPRTARAMRGCIEWPCGNRRNGAVKPSPHEEMALSRGW